MNQRREDAARREQLSRGSTLHEATQAQPLIDEFLAEVKRRGIAPELTVPGGWKERLRGVTVPATPPPLVVGRGGRDGDSGDLSTFLAWRLAQG